MGGNLRKQEFESMPLVSVIMPAYKVEKYLEQCLKSVVEQDLEDIEIIPIDNGSPDSCGEIIRRFAKDDKRIKPIYIEKNEGYAHAVNAGLDVATGKYISIVETDDYIEKDMLSSLYCVAEKYDAKIAKGGFTKLFSNGKTLYCKPGCTFYKEEVIVEPMCNNDILNMESSIWSAIYRRDFLLENDIRMQTFSGAAYQDVIFKFMAYTSVDFLVCINKSVYNYRVFSANSSSKSSQYWDRHFRNYEAIKEWLIKRGNYECYKHAYYISLVADFVFHYNRLSGEKRDRFCEEASKVCNEALSEGVDIFHPRFRDKQFEKYYYTDVISLLEKLTYKRQGFGESNEEVLVNSSHKTIKKLLKRLNKTRLFHALFDLAISILRKPFFLSKIVIEGQPAAHMAALHSMNTNQGLVELDYPTDNKKILCILPWYDNNAVTRNIDIIAAEFRRQGYETHLFVYWSGYAPCSPDAKVWDRVFWKHSDNWYFGRNDSTKAEADANRVDDWVADDFLESVIRLNNHYKYDICMANYLFFTSAFKVLPDSVKNLIYTHDRFAKRNSSLKRAGFSNENFWFSVATEEEEAAALNRADVVLAIQEEDGEYFRRITNNKKKVMVLPFIPDADFIKYCKSKKTKAMEVGYIASSNPPNIASIEKVAKLINKDNGIRLHIAGSITYALDNAMFSENIINEGIVESPRDFYSKCDIMINPDMFYSGLKVKTVEAMCYGAAIVCTKIASTCLPLEESYHQLQDEKACVEFLESLAAIDANMRINIINEMRENSRLKYEEYQKKYPLESLIRELCDFSSEA